MEIDGVQLSGNLRGKQVPLLLAYLVLNRSRHVGREELIGALWPYQAPVSQDAALRTLLSRLRSALGGPALQGRDELILALPEPVWVDLEAASAEIERAQEALDQGDARSAWARAQVPLNISSRGLLPGTQADWLEPPRRVLEDIRLQALETIGSAGLRLGGSQLASAERAARGLIELGPYRESGYVLLMQALAAKGNVAEALRVFERLRVLLRDELGTTPSPETIAAHRRLLAPGVQPGETARDDEVRGGGAGSVELPPELLASTDAPLVGRSSELAELGQLWELAAASNGDAPARRPRGRVVLLTGDPGIGKTRLVAQVAKQAHDAGAYVLAGRSPQETLVPYQPFVEALRHYLLNVPFAELRVSAREYSAELSRIVPELRRRAPELPAAASGEPETERYRLFEAVVGLLGEISARAPVLLVLDDLQWADRPTLLLLRHVARAAHPGRVLVLGAYRSTEALSESFSEALIDLGRERLITQLKVRGLSEQETAELVFVRAGQRPSPAFARALYAETEGNPLFVEEIVSHLTEAGVRTDRAGRRELERSGLPEGVKQVIVRRLDRLHRKTTELLAIAAVIGRDFELPLLEEVAAPDDEEQFLAALEEALATGLVVESAAGPMRYSFSHALIRETLYDNLSAARRARIHRRVGEALERSGGERQLMALALHFTRAASPDDAGKAIEYATRAAEQATEVLAHEEAAEHYLHALEVLERFSAEDWQRRAELLNLVGEAHVRAGERGAAWESFRHAAEIAGDRGDGAAMARAAIGASRRYIQEPGVVNDELIALLERALEMTEGERTSERVQLLARMCGALYYSTQIDRLPALCEEAAEIADELADPVAHAYAWAARRRGRWGPGRVQERLDASTELLRYARDVGNVELQLQAHAWLALDLLESGNGAALDAQLTAFVDGAQRVRQPLYLWQAGVWQAMRALLAGRLGDAGRLAQDALSASAGAEEVTAPAYHAIQLVAILREQARWNELERLGGHFVDAAPAVPAWRAAYARLLLDIGRDDEAREELAALAAEGFAAIPLDGNWTCTIAQLGDVAARLGDVASARTLYEMLLPHRDLMAVIGIGAVCLGSVEQYLGLLAATHGGASEAGDHFRRALSANERLGAIVNLAHVRLDYATVLGPRSKDGAQQVELAAHAAKQLGLPAVAERAEQLHGG